jgi:hypothetical protein
MMANMVMADFVAVAAGGPQEAIYAPWLFDEVRLLSDVVPLVGKDTL